MSYRRIRGNREPEQKGLSTGAKAAIIISIVVVIIIIIAVLIWFFLLRSSDTTPETTPETCTSNTDCSGTTPFCQTTTGACVACLTDVNCSGSTPKCRTSTGTCVSCLTDPDCDPGDECINFTCFTPPECTVDGDCISPTPACVDQFCLECSDSNLTECAAGEICNNSNTCECPVSPTPTTLIASYDAPGSISGSFTHTAGTFAYEIEISTSETPETGVIATGISASTAFEIAFVPSTEPILYVRVRATNECGNVSDWSANTVNSTVCLNPIMDPDGVIVTFPGGTSTQYEIFLNSAPPGTRTYEGSVRTAPNGGGTLLASFQTVGSGTSFTFTISGVFSGSRYLWIRDATAGCLEGVYVNIPYDAFLL